MSGSSARLGAVVVAGGVEFGVVSTTAERIEVCLFDAKGERELSRTPLVRGDDDIHRAFVPKLAAGSRYGLRVEGAYDPPRGLLFDPAKLLVDPYATALDRPFAYAPELAAPRPRASDTAALVPKAIVPAGASPPTPHRRHAPRWIYEVSVRAWTRRHPAIPEPLRGTVAALAHPAMLDYLTRLGVDTVELMPVAAWIDERHLAPLGLRNAWGYNPVAFMAPDPRLAPGGLAELRATVAALRQAGIAVILDAVFNHTGESDVLGPTLSLRGLDNPLYYRHAPDDPARLINDTGCGNTLAAERPHVVRLVVDAMRHWVEATGVDGFRLDLASTLGRLPDGFTPEAPLFEAIAADPVLSGVTMIAEPWDVGPGGYQLGNFPSGWREWNDRFRDDVRRFWQGAGTVAELATRLAGSSDIFENPGRLPSASVNFLAAHDGFTLNDLVSYADKHNLANGEQNRDGTAANFSWNNGVEGPSADPLVEAVRAGDIRAMLATLFVARGTPMLTAGDEMRRTQGGNNNAYAQDNAVTWTDWTDGGDRTLPALVSGLTALRRRHASLVSNRFLTGKPIDATGIPDAAWLHPEGREMTEADWENPALRALGVALYALDENDKSDRVAIWINGGPHPVAAWFPPPQAGCVWGHALSSAQSPADASDVPSRSVSIFLELKEK